ncbi:dephospho-CoA kinase [Methylomonas sp. SURF-2]|uniref:Dephospho-CoA kinase n=1 Tax=Methylomonas subterranea TaxID=2952225 RepID=A0ABT1TFL7_9GAMM|nr:dephospho-CoA kinase [Methylomonas sp. SURF-2]MCQ8104262.1 dephospho-CoA kinase [Methylomonas sp. SURF-2]
MLRVGLTGGIGSGKSTVCRLFAGLHVPIIDTDVIARQLVEPGQPALSLLAEVFGKEIIKADGSLDRARLRQLAFSDLRQKRQLDAIMHPLIFKEVVAQIAGLTAIYCLVVIPLLVETQNDYILDRVLLVDCPESMQIQRVMDRDGVGREQAMAVIAAQASRRQRLALAHDVIDNAVTADRLAEQVKRLHNSYLLLATAGTTSA